MEQLPLRALAENKNKDKVIRLAIFASGGGSNAKEILQYFKTHLSITVALVVTNKPQAGVVPMATAAGIPVLVLERERFFNGDGYVSFLKEKQIKFIVLAGFLWKVPLSLIEAFKGNIINIHPALLPKFGGKGMYGHHVHMAVIESGESESGITIHYVDEVYDHGDTIFQTTCPVHTGDTPTTLAKRVLALEHANYPVIIEQIILQKNLV